MLETITRPSLVAEPTATAPRDAPPRPRHGVAQRRRGGALRGFLLLVVLPTLAFVAWQARYVADQYAVEIRFAVRPADPARGALPAGMMAGLAGANTDAYAVVQHLQSPEAIIAAGRHADIRAILGNPVADWFHRLDPAAPVEVARRAWQRQVRPYFDRASGIVAVEMRAFSPEDALALASAVEGAAEDAVNAMSARSRAELLAAAERDVAAAEARFAAARAAVQGFRDRQQVVDPRRTAEGYSQHLVRLQSEQIAMTAQLASLRRVMSDNAGVVMQLRESLRATEQQIGAVQARITAEEPGGPALSATIGGFEAMETEVIFAQRAYEAAMGALERARAEAQRQQVFLAPVVRPVAPQQAEYPARIAHGLTFLAGSILAWFVGLLALRALKEHVA